MLGCILLAAAACATDNNEDPGVRSLGLGPAAGMPAAGAPGAAAGPAGEEVPSSDSAFPGRLIVIPASPEGTPAMVLATLPEDPAEMGCSCAAAGCRCKPLAEGGLVCRTADDEDCACTCFAGPVVAGHVLAGGGAPVAEEAVLVQEPPEEGAP
jgi:hypothetical protein